jgi:hypothetical protein
MTFNPNQPRVPAGNPHGGEFAGNQSGGGVRTPTEQLKGFGHSAAGNLTQEDIDAVSRFVGGGYDITPEDRARVAELAKTHTTKADHLERILRDDPKHHEGDVIDLPATSFTSVRVSKGKSAGQISWKYSDEAIYLLDNPKRGFDVPYQKLNSMGFSASLERETILAGKYRVKRAGKITEPGTEKHQGYKVKAYILEEVS